MMASTISIIMQFCNSHTYIKHYEKTDIYIINWSLEGVARTNQILHAIHILQDLKSNLKDNNLWK